jgi:aminoglycoside N3'-acetyltransferase
MQNTTTEPLSEEEEAAKQQQKLAELRRYNREYDHAHKQASACEHCKKVFSSVSALRRHQVKNLKCKLLQATETIEKFERFNMNG